MLTESILNYSKNQNVNLRKFKIYTHWLAGWLFSLRKTGCV